MKAVLHELDRLISADTEAPVLLSYDTTFQLGNFYLSPLLFRHVLFDEKPVIPVAFMIHERKFQSAHEEFVKFISLQLPSLLKLKAPIPIITDDESGICNAIDKCLPGVHPLLCWNHLINSIKAWLQHHRPTPEEIPIYVSHLRQLSHQSTERSYQQMLTNLQSDWSKAFVDYYMDNVHQQVSRPLLCEREKKYFVCILQVSETIGRWVLEKLKIYSPLSGVTNNQSEGFNTLLKHFEKWKEAPLDSMLLGLYQLQVYYHNEIQRGYGGLGNFSLSPVYSFAAIPIDELVTLSVTSPAEIVAKLRNG